MFLPLFATVLGFASTCIGLEDVLCGESKGVLESDPITLYGTADGLIDVRPIASEKGTKLWWKIVNGDARFVKRVYRRLSIYNVTQFAGASVWYTITRNGTTVYTSAQGTVRIGSVPDLSLTSLPTSGSTTPVITGDRRENSSICFQSSGYPHPIFSLYKEEVSGTRTLITLNSTFRFSKSCLEIRSPRLEDRGYYTLEAKNCFKSATKKFRLKVFEKPSVAIDFQRATGYVRIPTTPIVGVEVAVNGHLTLPYEVGGFPWPTVEWSHDNSTLDDSKYNASHFTLHNVELSDGGVYDVVAQSHLGRAQASFLLKVNQESLPNRLNITEIEVETTSPKERKPTLATATPFVTVTSVKTDPTESSEEDSTPFLTKGTFLSPNTRKDGKDASGFPLWTLAIILGGTVALIALIAVVFVYRRKGFCSGDDKDSKRRGSLGWVLDPSDQSISLEKA